MLPPGREVYHVKATPVRVVGKNLHHNDELVVYNSIRFLYAVMCSCGHDVPSKAAMFGTFIFPGLGVFSISLARGETNDMGSSGRTLLSASFRGMEVGVRGRLDPASCAFFLSSLLYSTRDWTLSDVFRFLLSMKVRASGVAVLDSPSRVSVLLWCG